MRDARDGIAEIIKSRGLKQTFVAKECGLSDSQMTDLIKHKRKLDTTELMKFCEILNVTPNDLFAG